MNGCSGENVFDIFAPDRITTSSTICLLLFFVVRIYSRVNVASFNARVGSMDTDIFPVEQKNWVGSLRIRVYNSR